MEVLGAENGLALVREGGGGVGGGRRWRTTISKIAEGERLGSREREREERE